MWVASDEIRVGVATISRYFDRNFSSWVRISEQSNVIAVLYLFSRTFLIELNEGPTFKCFHMSDYHLELFVLTLGLKSPKYLQFNCNSQRKLGEAYPKQIQSSTPPSPKLKYQNI